MRHELEVGLDLDACDIYGLSEVMGPGVAGESVETKDGCHIWEDHFRPEIIDPFDPTKVLGDGEPGELVFTSLTKEALPIIRYRTKDLTRLLPGTARPGMRRMGRITGRSDDMIILRGVNMFPSQIEEIALRIPVLSPHFQLELTRPEGKRMDQLAIKIEPPRGHHRRGAAGRGFHAAGADQDPRRLHGPHRRRRARLAGTVQRQAAPDLRPAPQPLNR